MALGTLVGREEETPHASATPHLSYSRINRYLLCPEQYRFYYIEHLRPKVESANLVFGTLIHQVIATYFGLTTDPVGSFEKQWDNLKAIPLRYSGKDAWQSLRDQGGSILEKFVVEEVGKISDIFGVETAFELNISSLDAPFIGVIDLFAEIRGERTVVDFKTSQSKYAAHEAALADQLTAYKLGEPAAEHVAFCVFVKTKKPYIQWLFSRRKSEELLAYLAKAEYVGRQIRGGHFFLRPGRWCAQCDYLPMCSGNTVKARESLVQINPYSQR